MKLWRIWILAVAVIFPLTSMGAASDEASLLSKKNAYEKKIDEHLKSFGNKLDELKARSQKAGVETRRTIDRQVDKLQAQLNKADAKLTHLKKQSPDHWEKFRKGVDNTVDSLERSYRKTLDYISSKTH